VRAYRIFRRSGSADVAHAESSRKPRKSVPAQPNPVIPDKLYFRIGEVARLLEIATYVLRFWETEFPQLHPTKGGTGQRLYRRRDVETALRIRQLLYHEGYTIPGARQFLKAETRQKNPELPFNPEPVSEMVLSTQKLRRVQAELQQIASLLARPLPHTRRLDGAQKSGSKLTDSYSGESQRTSHRGLHLTSRSPSPAEAVNPRASTPLSDVPGKKRQ